MIVTAGSRDKDNLILPAPHLLLSSSTGLRFLLFHAPAFQNDMDFSQLNAAEQAQMSRILEKKQVRFLQQIRVTLSFLTVKLRCKTS